MTAYTFISYEKADATQKFVSQYDPAIVKLYNDELAKLRK